MNDIPDLWLATEQKSLRSLRELYFELGLILSSSEQNRIAEAIPAYEAALKEHDRDSLLPSWKIYTRLALTYERIKNFQSAFRSYLEAIMDAPRWTSNLLPHVHALLKQLTPEMLGEEQEWLQQVWIPTLSQAELNETDRANIALFLGRTALRMQQYEKARDYYEQALQINSQSIHILEGLGQALMHLGELEKSIEVFRQAYDLAKKQNQAERIVAISNKLARALAFSGQYETALMQFNDTYTLVGEEKLLDDPSYACKMYLTFSQCLLALGEAESALEAAEFASKYDLIHTSTTARVTYELLRTRIFISLRRYDDALSAADQALQQDPFSNEALLCKIQILFEGRIDVGQARRQLRRYMKKVGADAALTYAQTAARATKKTDGNGHYFLAQFYYTLGRYPEARQELEQALQLKLTDAGSSANVAIAQLKAELFEAEGHIIEAADSFYTAGRELFVTTIKYGEVIELLTRAVELDSGHGLAWLFLSAALSTQASTTIPPSGELLQQAFDAWDKSYALGLPPVNPAWAYAVRADCLSKRRDLHPEDKERLLWEAVCYLERAVILDTHQGYLWDTLQAHYVTLHKSAVAQEISEEHPSLIGELLTHVFQDDEFAIDAIDRYHNQLEQGVYDPTQRVDQFKAVLLILRGRYDEAIQCILHYQEAFPHMDNAALHYYLGRCYRFNGKVEEALAEFQWIWEATSPGRKLATDSNLTSRADAAFELGYNNEAIDIYQSTLAGAGKGSFDVHSYLAYCYLLSGQIDAAREKFHESLTYMEHIAEGHAALLDLVEMETKLREKADNAPALALIQTQRAAIEEKIGDLQSRPSSKQTAAETLRLVLEDTEIQRGSFSWLAAEAGLARLDIGARSWQSAIARYETLLQCNNENSSRCFPEASIGLARAHALCGCDLALQGDRETALNYLKRGLDLYAETGQNNPVLEMMHDCSQLINSHEQYSIICQCLRVLTDVSSLEHKERQSLLAARLTLSSEKYPGIIHPTELNDSSDGKKPAEWKNEFGWTTPSMGSFAIELGLDLLIVGDYTTTEDSVEGELMHVCLRDMRTRIREQFGVIVPGFQIRDNLNIDVHAYQFLSYKKLLATGSVLPKEKYCPDAKSCLALGIDGTPMLNPIDGSEGLWLQKSGWEQAKTAGLPLWSPYDYITFHLETLIQSNLARLIGVQETQITVQEWVDQSKVAREEFVKLALPDDLAVARLARVLRGLVEEQVPIKDLDTILQLFAQKNARASNILEIIEAIRRALSPVLPGNNTEQQVMGFSAEFEEAVARWIWNRDNKLFLAVPQEENQALLQCIRECLAGRDTRNLTLLVRKPGLRPYIRKLVAQMYPKLHVLAKREAIEALPPVSEQIGFSSIPVHQKTASILDDAGPILETGPTPAPDILSFTLASLADLSILNANESLVLQEIDAGSIHHTSAEDIVEIAFARLRSSRINIQLPSEYVNKETDSASDHKVLPAFLRNVEEQLFYERGILLPQFDLLPTTSENEIIVQINDRSLPLVAIQPLSTDELAKQILDILSKTAKALISIDDLEYRIARLYTTHPTLVKAALARFSLEDLTRVARGLVSKGETILDLRLVLEQLLEFDTIPIAPATYAILDSRLAISPGTSQASTNSWQNYLKFLNQPLLV